MKATSAIFLAAAGASLASATPTAFASVDARQSNVQCPGPDGNFCVGDSMSTLLACTAGIPGPVTDCHEHTAAQPPVDSKEASCYQSSPISGDAACTKNCMVYPANGGNSYKVPGDCKVAEAAPSEAAAPPAYAPETEHAPEEAPPAAPAAEAPPADAHAPSSAAPMEAMPTNMKPPFGPMFLFNMTFPPIGMPPAAPSSSAEAPPPEAEASSAPLPEAEASSAPPAPPMSMPPFVPPMMPTEAPPAPSAPAPEVFSKPLIEASSAPAAPVFSKPMIEAPSAPPAAPPVLETPTPTPAAAPPAPPAAAPPAPPAEAPPAEAPPAPSSAEAAPPAMSAPAPAAPPASSAAPAAPPSFSLPPFMSHMIGNWVHPPASSIPLPTTDMLATSTIPMAPITHSYPSPSPEGPGAPYTYATSSDFSLLPKATLPPYITTVTVGTKTQYHTIFSDCGNGTMVFGSSTIALPTGKTPNEVPVWSITGGSYPPVPTLTTVPCSEASGWNNTALHTPKTSASYSYIATLPAGATPTAPNSQFSQGDGYDHAGAASGTRVSVFVLAGLVFGIAAMAL